MPIIYARPIRLVFDSEFDALDKWVMDGAYVVHNKLGRLRDGRRTD